MTDRTGRSDSGGGTGVGMESRAGLTDGQIKNEFQMVHTSLS